MSPESMPEWPTGTLRIVGLRGGTITEITEFLRDLEAAYLQLYGFQRRWIPWSLSRSRHFLLEYFLDSGFPFSPALAAPEKLSAASVLPQHRLILTRVSIESPGFWEFLASLNPLQQIREYLNDRHRRRQDREYRELSERERLSLENELLEQQIREKENTFLSQRVQILRDIGVGNDEIRQFLWSQVGTPLAGLGQHQDKGLIAGAEKVSDEGAHDAG